MDQRRAVGQQHRRLHLLFLVQMRQHHSLLYENIGYNSTFRCFANTDKNPHTSSFREPIRVALLLHNPILAPVYGMSRSAKTALRRSLKFEACNTMVGSSFCGRCSQKPDRRGLSSETKRRKGEALTAREQRRSDTWVPVVNHVKKFFSTKNKEASNDFPTCNVKATQSLKSTSTVVDFDFVLR